jgi:transposase
MAEQRTQGCRRCKRLIAERDKLKKRVAELEAELAKARKHSGNSSKPPSSDITNPPKSKQDKNKGKKDTSQKRKPGGQPGHPRHERPAFEQDQIDNWWEYRYPTCPCCGGQLSDLDEPPKVQQQVDLEVVPIQVEEHHRIGQRCERCDKTYYAPFPKELVKAGLFGPRLTALVGFLKGACHMSVSSIRRYFRDVIGVRISRGMLAKLVGKVSQSLKDPYDELLSFLPHEDQLNVDETGHKDNGRKLWTWCFRASLYTLFKISPSRGSNVLVDVLGEEFNGVLGCDYFSAYRKYMKDFDVSVQFCLAHFIRDVKFLVEHPNPKNRAYGKRLVEHLRKLFAVFHRREEYPTEEGFRRALGRVRNDLVWAAVEDPCTDEAYNISERFYQHYESYFCFITTPGVEPTNNLAEQAIRFVAIHRRLTQGTRGIMGQTWCERIWTVIATCDQQGQSILDFIQEAVIAYFSGNPAPSLLGNAQPP